MKQFWFVVLFLLQLKKNPLQYSSITPFIIKIYKPSPRMACSKYQYVKTFQQSPTILPQTYAIIRIDGRGFTKFCEAHNFQKPNDLRAIKLMNEAADHVCRKFMDIWLAYGQSDQYSFVLARDTELFSRRIDKIETCVVSAFTSAYVHNWPRYFPQCAIKQLPSFDARLVQYPTLQIVKDYFRWRQVDCHINNLYNTTFWCLVKSGMKNTEVENKLKDTNSGGKNQILFKQFGINYNDIDQVYRRGTTLCYKIIDPNTQQTQKDQNKKKGSPKIVKDLRTTIRQLKEASLTTDRIVAKLSGTGIEEDLGTCKELQVLVKELEGIRGKYEEIEERERKSGKVTVKDKNVKIQLRVTHEDLINEEFWTSIKLS